MEQPDEMILQPKNLNQEQIHRRSSVAWDNDKMIIMRKKKNGFKAPYLPQRLVATPSNNQGLPIHFFGEIGDNYLAPIPEQSRNELSALSEFLDFTNQQNQPNKRGNSLAKQYNKRFEKRELKSYNYLNGYSRLVIYMNKNISPSNQQHIFGVLSIIRPVFRGLTRSLPESELLKIEERFERYMFDYDCLFNVMPIPACLWRRTGEIYKANKQFASLLNIPLDQLREGMLCIYEFMTEESLVHYYDKFGTIASKTDEKAIITSIVLRNKDLYLKCSCSLTIRRDQYDMPIMIVGNFLPVPNHHGPDDNDAS